MKKNKGITLIALVITVIVLLILAGISISLLTGQNGLLTRAAEAKKETERAKRNEKIDLARLDNDIDEIISGTKVEQVTDENPGTMEGSGTEANPYIINSIEDLVVFANNVKTGADHYNGKTVKLGQSLDFNSTKSYVEPLRTDYATYGYNGQLKTLLTSGEGFKSIGQTTADANSFEGIFDGQNNFISHLYINKESNEPSEKVGLFSNNLGTIKNLKVLNVTVYLKGKKGVAAGLSGQNSASGLIENCMASGNVENESDEGRNRWNYMLLLWKYKKMYKLCKCSCKTSNRGIYFINMLRRRNCIFNRKYNTNFRLC